MPDPFKRGPFTWACVLTLALPLGCAPQPGAAPMGAPITPATASVAPAPELDAGPGDAGAEASPSSDAGPPGATGDEPDTVEATRLAQDLLRRAGSIAYSPSTSTFMYLLSHLEEGNGEGLTLYLAHAGDAKPFETLRVCEAWECERNHDARVERMLPKVVERMRGKGYVLLAPVPWPAGKSQITLATPALTLHWKRDHLVATQPGRVPATFAPVHFRPPHTATPQTATVVPDGAWLAVEITFDPHSGYGKGYNVYSEVHTYRVP
jgi:hypothetical protein